MSLKPDESQSLYSGFTSLTFTTIPVGIPDKFKRVEKPPEAYNREPWRTAAQQQKEYAGRLIKRE